MTTLIDLKQPAILSALLDSPAGVVIPLCDVPKGGTVKVSDDGWLAVDDGEHCELTVDVGVDCTEPDESPPGVVVVNLSEIPPDKWRRVF